LKPTTKSPSLKNGPQIATAATSSLQKTASTARLAARQASSLVDLKRDVKKLHIEIDALRREVEKISRLPKREMGPSRLEAAETMSLLKSIAITSLAGRLFRSPPIAALAVGIISVLVKRH
jgi:hypothetical protein